MGNTEPMEGQMYPLMCAPPIPLAPGAFGTAEPGPMHLVEVETSVCPSGWQVQAFVPSPVASPPTAPEPTVAAPIADMGPAPGSPGLQQAPSVLSQEPVLSILLLVLVCGVILGFIVGRARYRVAGNPSPRAGGRPPGNAVPRSGVPSPSSGGSDLRIGRHDSWS
jgi:hypothetical protein